VLRDCFPKFKLSRFESIHSLFVLSGYSRFFKPTDLTAPLTIICSS
jgi:hypothetical protein